MDLTNGSYLYGPTSHYAYWCTCSTLHPCMVFHYCINGIGTVCGLTDGFDPSKRSQNVKFIFQTICEPTDKNLRKNQQAMVFSQRLKMKEQQTKSAMQVFTVIKKAFHFWGGLHLWTVDNFRFLSRSNGWSVSFKSDCS